LRKLSKLRVHVLSASRQRGVLRIGNVAFPCALGRTGVLARKREGDGASPRGTYRLVSVFYRADRMPRPVSGLPVRRVKTQDGWCDAPADRNYNRHILHPYPASAERLWRDDQLYDLVVVTDHNARPRIKGAGSAIFMHVARPDYPPTEGCIALAPAHLKWVVGLTGRRSRILIGI